MTEGDILVAVVIELRLIRSFEREDWIMNNHYQKELRS